MKTIKLFDIDHTLIATNTQIYVDEKPYDQHRYKEFIAAGKSVDLKDFDSKEQVKIDFNEGEKMPLFQLLKYYGPLFKKAFITARSQEGEIERWFIRNRILGHFYAVNDPESRASCYQGMEQWKQWNTAERKAKIILYYCNKYDLVEFYDDDPENLKAAQKLNVDNLVLWLVAGNALTLYGVPREGS